jgi:glycosyltransferase involved in cell wall biosynthesis
MKVLFDHQAFVLQEWGGVSRYHFELVRGLPCHHEVELALARSRNVYVPQLNLLAGLAVSDRGFRETFLGHRAFLGRKQLYSVAKRLFPTLDAPRANRELSLERIRSGAYDLFHPTYFDSYFLESLRGRPFVLTVYDLTHDVFPGEFQDAAALSARRRLLAGRAARILAISEATKRDVVARLGIDPGKVDVTPLGFAWAAPAEEPPPLPERYVLFTGARHGYKNWALFVEAIAPVLLDHRDLHLVCTGHPLDPEERELLARLGLGARVVQVRATEGQLRAVYARAAAFVFPSRYEGFGIPVLEAFAEGCPAALARTTSLPEVGGDAAIYFDPTDAGSIRDALSRLLGDRTLRADLVARGRSRLAQFTWEATCARTAETYRRAVSAVAA